MKGHVMSKPTPPVSGELVRPSAPPTTAQCEVIWHCYQTLTGKVLTLIDSLIPSGPQNKATKDVMRDIIWDNYDLLSACLQPPVVIEKAGGKLSSLCG